MRTVHTLESIYSMLPRYSCTSTSIHSIRLASFQCDAWLARANASLVSCPLACLGVRNTAVAKSEYVEVRTTDARTTHSPGAHTQNEREKELEKEQAATGNVTEHDISRFLLHSLSSLLPLCLAKRK
jgi:hypothetical protein